MVNTLTMRRTALQTLCSATIVSCFHLAVPVSCQAIGFFEADFDAVHQGPGGTFLAPDDLLRPTNGPFANIGGVGGTGGTIISKSWLLTALHVAPAQGSENIFIDGVTYRVAERLFAEGSSPDIPKSDLALLKLENLDGSPVDLLAKSIPISTDPTLVLPGTAMTIAGRGPSRRFVAPGVWTATKPAGELRWGRNLIVGTALDGRQGPGLRVAFNDPASSLSGIKYEGQGDFGDSGGGWFVRDGWDWRVIGANSAIMPDYSATFAGRVSDPAIAAWISSAIAGDPANQAPTPIPAATNQWQGLSTLDWASPNWTSGAPSSQSNTWVNNDPHVTANTAQAYSRNLFVGADGSSSQSTDGTLTIDGGALSITDTVYLGAEEGDSGTLIQNGGTLSSAAQYVGFRGIGTHVQYSGHNEIDGALNVGRYGGSATNRSRYIMRGSSTLNAAAIHVAGGAGSHGAFEIRSGGTQQFAAPTVIVGGDGTGTFTQQGGSLDVGSLMLGYSSAGSGTYALSAGQIDAGELLVGVNGTGAFTQTGGVLSVTSGLNIRSGSSFTFSGGTLQMSGSGGGTITLNGPAARVEFPAGLTSANGFVFQNSGQHGQLWVPNESLALIGGGAFGSLLNANALPPHVVGNPLVISSKGFRGGGNIPDPVILSGNGYIKASGALSVRSLDLSGAAVVTLEANSELLVETGITASGGTVILDQDSQNTTMRVNTVQTFVPGIEVKNGSRLITSGVIDGVSTGGAIIEDGGVLEIGPSRDTLELIMPLTVEEGGTLEMNVSVAGSEQLRFFGTVNFDGMLALDVPATSLPARRQANVLIDPISVAGTFPTVDSVRAGIDGNFSIQTTVVPSPNSPLSQQMALAVLYPEDFDGDSPNDFSLGTIPSSQQNAVFVRATLPGDLNGDDIVNMQDFLILQPNFDQPGSYRYAQGDINGDGSVTMADYSIMTTFWDATWNSTGPGTPIPEPAAGILGLLAGASLVVRRRHSHS